MKGQLIIPEQVKELKNGEIARLCDVQYGDVPGYVIAELFRRLDDLSKVVTARVATREEDREYAQLWNRVRSRTLAPIEAESQETSSSSDPVNVVAPSSE